MIVIVDHALSSQSVEGIFMRFDGVPLDTGYLGLRIVVLKFVCILVSTNLSLLQIFQSLIELYLQILGAIGILGLQQVVGSSPTGYNIMNRIM